MAEQWFSEFEGAGLDGVVAKPLGAAYEQNARTMLKIKHERTADCVVAGYREHKTSTPERPLLGSLLLGLYADGELQHVGVSASFTEKRRAELSRSCSRWSCRSRTTRGAVGGVPHRQPRPGARARRAAGAQGKDLCFTPLRPERVVEVAYDHMEGRRFRHTAQFRRWRTDRDPESCGYEQLEELVSYDLGCILGVGQESTEDDTMSATYDVVLLVEQALTAGGRPPGALPARGARRAGRLPRAAAARGRRGPHRGRDGLARRRRGDGLPGHRDERGRPRRGPQGLPGALRRRARRHARGAAHRPAPTRRRARSVGATTRSTRWPPRSPRSTAARRSS